MPLYRGCSMQKMMKALVKREAKPGLRLEEVPVPQIGYHDVLIRVQKSSICGTDVHIYDWNHWAQRTIKPPLVIGHEFVGVVEKTGAHVTDFKRGDLVSGEGHLVCGHCRNCMAGRRHLCRMPSAVGVNRDGAFAEYISMPMTNVWYADSNISKEIISLFDPLGNAVHTALTFDVLGEDVLITGAGPIGLMAIPIVIHAGVRYVVITDVNPYRLALAREMGATMAVDVRTERVEDAQRSLGMLEGFDVGLEMSGSPDALRTMLENMCHGGKIAILGIQEEKAAIDWNLVIFNGLHLKGIYGREMYETWYKMTSMIQTGLDVSPVITHRFEYSDYLEAFETVRSGKSGKVILNWENL